MHYIDEICGGWGESAFGQVLLFTKTEFHNQAIMKRCTTRKWSVAIASFIREILSLYSQFFFLLHSFYCRVRNVIKRHKTESAFLFVPLREVDSMNSLYSQTDIWKSSSNFCITFFSCALENVCECNALTIYKLGTVSGWCNND